MYYTLILHCTDFVLVRLSVSFQNFDDYILVTNKLQYKTNNYKIVTVIVVFNLPKSLSDVILMHFDRQQVSVG